ncbi:TonB-dependent receptor plug domain-containing protein [Rhodovastum atsumiense]|uniref:TonB-dependent receptor plug domain-containing protein n=1 Tax=Rhodovastum atsumiense TaxID=504468 RepID=A0A5M6IZV5_9PROT|nr:TonB-dependent receptor [Rhodovastum atsumiense]KAA5613509.1 TonB-dependent receptor plug domain-containing protein [Rhodovastum atsumiense]CAH2603256.1 TonB-dependent receptor plug domain-containing protein [Rhodovastum atsumiense]
MSALLLALAAGTPLPAAAQELDRGALEQLFGEPVTTAATGKPQRASDVPANMDIITRDDIRRSGAGNIPELLRFVTGIDLRRSSFADVSVAIRGNNQPQNGRLLVLLNGRQVYRDDYGSVTWQTIPVEMEEIRQIEVVKGPASALFGFNAVSGVINIVTYDPLQDPVNVLAARTGTQSLAAGTAITTVRAFDRLGLRVSAGGYLAKEYDRSALQSGIAGQPLSPRRGVLSADSKVRVAPGVEVGLYASDTSAQNLAFSPYGMLSANYYRTNAVRGYVQADTPIGLLDLNAYRNELRFRSSTSAIAWNNVVYVVQASDLVKLGTDHAVRLGVEYRNNSVDSGFVPGGGSFGGAVGYQVVAGSAMWDWQITPTLSLTNAVRLDHLMLNKNGNTTSTGFTSAWYNDISFTAVSYNSGLVYRVTELDTVRLTTARGVQAPSLLILGATNGGNPGATPAVVTNYELSHDRSLPFLGATLRNSIFYQRTEDILSTVFGGPTILAPNGRSATVAGNIGASDEIGWEIGLKGRSESGLHWNVSYALTSVTDHTTVNKGPQPNSIIDYQRGTPVHNVIVGGGYAIGKWEFDLQARWQSRFRDYAPTDGIGRSLRPVIVADYLTANARIGYAVTETLTLALAVAQLNQSRIVQTAGGVPVERRVLLSATARF